MKLYKNQENGKTMIINNSNLESLMEREGFELVGECDEKGKIVKAEKKEE